MSDVNSPRVDAEPRKIVPVDSIHVTRARLAKKVEVSQKSTEKISVLLHKDLELQRVHFVISAGLFGALKLMDAKA